MGGHKRHKTSSTNLWPLNLRTFLIMSLVYHCHVSRLPGPESQCTQQVCARIVGYAICRLPGGTASTLPFFATSTTDLLPNMNARGSTSATALRRLMTEYKQLTAGGSPDGMFTAGACALSASCRDFPDFCLCLVGLGFMQGQFPNQTG